MRFRPVIRAEDPAQQDLFLTGDGASPACPVQQDSITGPLGGECVYHVWKMIEEHHILCVDHFFLGCQALIFFCRDDNILYVGRCKKAAARQHIFTGECE